jgi:Tfp pilus assembly protein PilF
VILAAATERLGRREAAIKLLTAAIKIDPQPAALSALGDLHAAAGDLEAAEAAFRTAVERAPESADARVHLGRFLSTVDRYEEAEAQLQEAVRIDGDDERANRALAALLMAGGRADAAEPYLKRAAAHPAQQYNSLLALADFYAGAGRLADARSVLEHAPAEGVLGRAARVRLAAVRYEMGDTEAAHAMLDDILKQKPSAEGWTVHAQLLARERRHDEALKAARQAVAMRPDSAAAHLIIAAVERELGNKAASDAALKAAQRSSTPR